MPKFSNHKTIPTKYLKAIIECDGINHNGTKDYGNRLEELQDELNRRMTLEDSKEHDKYLREIEQQISIKICTICKVSCNREDVPSHFYLKRGKFRSECKECSKNKIRKTRKLAKIKMDEIPF